MPISVDERIVAHYRKLEQALCDRFPEVRKEAQALAASITGPVGATADEVWAHAWHKPLYANTRVETGKRWIEKLSPHMSGAWQRWGGDEFQIDKVGTGSATAAFVPVDSLARRIRAETGIAMYRLFAIQGAAVALRTRASKSSTPYANLIDLDPSTMIATIQREMGPGWGPVTVLHFLTDLGLACKPDLHLVRTVLHLAPELPIKAHKVPNLNESILINRWVRSLAEAYYGSFSPARLRYTDKILMEISGRKII